MILMIAKMSPASLSSLADFLTSESMSIVSALRPMLRAKISVKMLSSITPSINLSAQNIGNWKQQSSLAEGVKHNGDERLLG